ncbi:MAG: hypothetical protein WCH52_08575 [Bacteroidota bacterium]
MKSNLITSVFFCLFISAHAQHISKEDLNRLKIQEDSMKKPSIGLIQGINASDRFKADSIFTKTFVRALKTRNSFYYPFDSLFTISKLYSPDSLFKIYTWQLIIDDNIIRQHGAIQMNTADGILKLFPLIDKSENTQKIQDTIANNYGWMGAVYYKIILNKAKDKSIYTLLGFDEDNIRCNRKFIEVLHFENEEPIFGGNYFDFRKDSSQSQQRARHIMEFKKEAGPRLTFDREMNMIIMEHLVSESNEPKKKWTLVGDGDYEGFKWNGTTWVYIPKVFDNVTPEGKTPMPKPLLDEKGNIDNSNLKVQ